MSRGQAQPRNQYGRRVLERCRTRDRVEIIDVDRETVDVVIVDTEETSHQEHRGSGMTKNNFPDDVISIDDGDGDADETLRNVHADYTSKELHPVSSNSPMSEESKGDECLMTTRKEKPLFESMKYTRKKKYYDVGPSVNWFGLGCSSGSWSDNDRTEVVSESSVSESVCSDSDSSDCEIMEDSSGNIREQWERAALRKRMSFRCHFYSEDQTTASGPSADVRYSNGEESCSKIDVENCLKKIYSNQSKEMPSKCCPNNLSSGEENLSFNIPTTVELGEPFCKRNINTAGIDVDPTTNTCRKEPENVSETCETRAQSMYKHHSDNLGSDFQEPEMLFTSESDLNMQHDPNAEENNVSSADAEEQIPTASTFCANGYHAESSFWGKMVSHSGKSSPCNPQSHNGEPLTPDSTIQDKEEYHHERPSFSVHPLCGFVARETAGCREKEKPPTKDSPVCNINGGNGTPGRSVSSDTEPEDIPQEQSGFIFERESHKESDEYRRATEEEWAARQQQLQIQAEEAQRLKRRKKAETLRLLDMERRQNQRLEEIRASEKKAAETINLKEHVRAEVRKELDQMELRYSDMASLLRGLGIPVKGGPFPLPCEVNAAYKQALLRFHPDRASRSDIHQQVRAEETFKLISRLKEKLCL